MGKTRDCFKKIGIIKETFLARMGTIKDRNGKDLTEAKEGVRIHRIYSKGLNDPENHDDVATYLEADILECEVKWAFRGITMNKARGGDEIPAELFQILNDDAV